MVDADLGHASPCSAALVFVRLTAVQTCCGATRRLTTVGGDADSPPGVGGWFAPPLVMGLLMRAAASGLGCAARIAHGMAPGCGRSALVGTSSACNGTLSRGPASSQQTKQAGGGCGASWTAGWGPMPPTCGSQASPACRPAMAWTGLGDGQRARTSFEAPFATV